MEILINVFVVLHLLGMAAIIGSALFVARGDRHSCSGVGCACAALDRHHSRRPGAGQRRGAQQHEDRRQAAGGDRRGRLRRDRGGQGAQGRCPPQLVPPPACWPWSTCSSPCSGPPAADPGRRPRGSGDEQQLALGAAALEVVVRASPPPRAGSARRSPPAGCRRPPRRAPHRPATAAPRGGEVVARAIGRVRNSEPACVEPLDVERRHLPARGTEQREQAAGPQRGERRVEGVLADPVVGHVDARARR